MLLAPPCSRPNAIRVLPPLPVPCAPAVRSAARAVTRSGLICSSLRGGDRADVEKERNAVPPEGALAAQFGAVRDLAQPLHDQVRLFECSEVVLQRAVRVEEGHAESVALDRHLSLRA